MASQYRILTQLATRDVFIPSTIQLREWAKFVLKKHLPSAELTIRIVDENEITLLNKTYRHKHKATNVLSFPFDLPPDIKMNIPLLGDIVICASVVQAEAAIQQKPLEAHWAHMVVHGTLHLLGYDHENDADADLMEEKEIDILTALGFADPYQTTG